MKQVVSRILGFQPQQQHILLLWKYGVDRAGVGGEENAAPHKWQSGTKANYIKKVNAKTVGHG